MQLRQRLGVAPIINGAGFSSSPMMNAPPLEQTSVLIQGSGVSSISAQLQPQHPAPTPATIGVVGGEPKKTAAAMADKLASLSAPEELLSSIFNKMKAEAASENSGSPSGEFSAGPPGFQLEKRPRIEKPTMPSDIGGGTPFFGQAPQVQQQRGVPTSVGGTQQTTPANQAPGSFPQTLPPLPSLLPPPLQQFAQNTGGIIGMGPYSMMSGSMPPPPPLSNIMPGAFPGPNGPPPPPPLPRAQNQPQQQSLQEPQQSPTSAGFFQPSGVGFFPPVQVQQSPSVQRQ
jgi:regulator of Ty1 transposition protein 103